MICEIVLASAVGALLWLDRFQFLQVMFSRPIVAAPVVGWMLGDFDAGLASGLLFELVWLRRPPLGGFIGPDVTLGSMAVASVSAATKSQTDIALLPLVFLTFLLLFPVPFLGIKLDVVLRKYLGNLARKAEALQASGHDMTVLLYFGSALIAGFSLAFMFLVSVSIMGSFIMSRIIVLAPPSLIRASGIAFFVVPLLGAMDLLAGLDPRPHAIFFISGLLAALGGCFLLG